jgi:hypothetical protein
MPKHLLFFVIIVLISISTSSYSQCAGSPNPACVNSNGPCGSFSDGVIGQFYSDTISFWAPKRVDASVQSGGLYDSLDFVEFQVLNITGLPVGITWNCNSPSCIYNPQPNGILASVNFCGTPISPGQYTVTFTIKGTVSTPIGNQSQNQVYSLPMLITQGIGSNSAFSFSPSSGCDSAIVNFSPLLNFPLPQVTEYLWNFGSGNTYNGPNPPPQSYDSAGIYPVTLTTNIYNLKLVSLNINVCGQGWWCGDIEEANCGNGNADLIPTFTTGSSSWNGNEATDNCNPTWSSLGHIFTTTAYSISMIENDVISQDDIPPPYSGTINGPGTYSFNNPGNYSGSFTVELSLANQITVTDTVFIYNTPVQDTITAASFSFCPYESTTLSVDPGMLYEWFLNDTVLVQSGTNNEYTTQTAGSYIVKITDPISGCFIYTPAQTVTQSPIVPPGFPNVGINNNNGVFTTILTGNYTWQWLYFDGINYSPIGAPEGNLPSYTPTFNGTYCLVATNAFGCLDTSNCLGFYIGLDDPFASNKVVIYPNPTNGKFSVYIQHLEKNLDITVMNMLGEKVEQRNNIAAGEVNEMFDLSGLRSGIYLLELTSNNYRRVERIVLH